MQIESWLRLADYANKYQVSISTLRRRIKNGSVHYRFDDGKYLLRDTTPSAGEKTEHSEQPETLEHDQMRDIEEPILTSANQLLTELKRAYMNVLHEKEEQIIQLKEEVSDLKTLVRVLEEDNERLRRIHTHQSSSRP